MQALQRSILVKQGIFFFDSAPLTSLKPFTYPMIPTVILFLHSAFSEQHSCLSVIGGS